MVLLEYKGDTDMNENLWGIVYRIEVEVAKGATVIPTIIAICLINRLSSSEFDLVWDCVSYLNKI